MWTPWPPICNGKFHRLRQSGIDEELFDVISGFEALEINQRLEYI